MNRPQDSQTQQAANLSAGMRITRVVMPLVKLMAKHELSWSDRELVADSIQRALTIFDQMEDEGRYLLNAAQQLSGGSSHK